MSRAMIIKIGVIFTLVVLSSLFLCALTGVELNGLFEHLFADIQSKKRLSFSVLIILLLTLISLTFKLYSQDFCAGLLSASGVIILVLTQGVPIPPLFPVGSLLILCGVLSVSGQKTHNKTSKKDAQKRTSS